MQPDLWKWMRAKLATLLRLALVMGVLYGLVLLVQGNLGQSWYTVPGLMAGILLFGGVPILLVSWLSDRLAPLTPWRKGVALLIHVLGVSVLALLLGPAAVPMVALLGLMFWALDEQQKTGSPDPVKRRS